MNDFNSFVAFIVTMISFLGSIAIFTMSFYYPDSIFFYLKNRKMYSYNKNISNYANYQFFSKNNTLNVSLKNNINISRIESFHNSLFLNKFENEYNIPKEELPQRKLKPDILNYFNIAIFINFLSFYLCFYLFISFFIEKNECVAVGACCTYVLCCECCNCNCSHSNSSYHSDYQSNNNNSDCGDCNCDCKCDCNCESSSNSNDGGGAGCLVIGLIILAIALAILIIVGITYGTYFFTKKCGKNLSRYIVLTMLLFNNLAILILCLLLIKSKELLLYIIMGISGTIILSNILSMIFTNICQKKESKILLPMFKDVYEEKDKNITQGNNTPFCPETPYYENNNSDTPGKKAEQTIN